MLCTFDEICHVKMMNMVGSGIELCRNIVSLELLQWTNTLFRSNYVQFLRVVYLYIFSLRLFHSIN